MSALLDTFASYVPTLTLNRIAKTPTPLTTPKYEHFPAAVLFADISGFTALAEQLGKQGPAGAEELGGILNDYFGQLTALIAEHGGDVVKFAGDALLAVWPVGESNQDVRTVALRAAQCGLVAQKELSNYQASAGARLSMRMAIGVGEADTMYIGGAFGRWEFLIAGEPVLQVSLAEKEAQPGQVVLSPEAWALVEDVCTGKLLQRKASQAVVGVELKTVQAPLTPRPLSIPTMDAQTEAALRGYIPGAILARLSAGQGTGSGGETISADWLAELRRVSVIFINLPDFSHNLPLEQAQTVMRRMQKALNHYEGSVNKLSVDDKGVTLVAALGLPPLAHEDDATRATLVALEIQDALQKLDVRSAIGIATGQAFCGAVGNELRREYTMIGDVINLAARLMQAAPDTILCSPSTYQASQGSIIFDELPAITVKGKAEPIVVYQPTGEKKTAIRPQSEIVGRRAEREALGEGIQTLLRGGTGVNVFVIEGEAGIGKSRLVDDIRRQADALGVITYSGSGEPVEKSTPYYSWRSIFAQLFELDLFTDLEKTRRHIRVAMGPGLVRLAPLLNSVLPIKVLDNETTILLGGQARAEQTRSLLVQLLQASITRSPKVLIIEDAHWLDSASWALVLAVSQQVRPLLLVIATRPIDEPIPAEYKQLIQAGNVQHLRLEALSKDDSLALVCQRLRVSSLPAPVAALIRERAEGNPFFSEELAYALRDAGLIEVVDGECYIAPETGDLNALQFPDTVQGVITSRIDRLAPSQQMALKVASVIGRVFTFRTLLDVHPIEADKPQLAQHVSALERLDLTPLESPEPDLAYIFKHIITQEVAYNLMLFAQRRELHRAVAESYEVAYADQLTPYYPLLAHHWSRAEAWSKTYEYRILAGDAATALYSYAEASLHYLGALEALTHLPDTDENRRAKADAVFKLANVSSAAHDPQQNLARLTEIETILKELPGPDGVPGSDRLRLARAHYWMGRSHYLSGAMPTAIGYYRQVLAVAPELGDQELLAIPSSVMGQALTLQGHYNKAEALLWQAIEPLEKTGNWIEWLRAVGFLGIALTARGNRTEGLVQGQRALVRAEEMKNPVGLTLIRLFNAFMHLLGGDLDMVLEKSGAVIETTEPSRGLLYVYIGYGFTGWAYSRMGEHQTALDHFAKSKSFGQTLGGRLILADAFAAAEAEIFAASGRSEEAIKLAETVVTAAQAGGGIFAQGVAERAWATALGHLNPARRDEAETHLAASLQCLETGDNRLEAARTHVAWGLLSQDRGNASAAREHFEKAVAQFESSGLTRELEQVRGFISKLA
jgi:class 3 adenylate cyclase/tetratricopeptide (TPR) repeat protein